VLEQCSRPAPNPESYWTPDDAVIAAAEANLAQVTALRPAIAAPRAYLRQYVGINLNAKRLLYLNAAEPQHFHKEPGVPATVCDGGDSFWGAIFDPETRRFRDIRVNGVA
jgi:hypothetical protein